MDARIARVLSGKGENYIFPFLWLHGEDEQTLRHYVRVIKNASMQAFCVESRPHPDFAGEGWWRDLDVIIDEAKRCNMKVWILDDSHFPTGYANGALKNCSNELCRQSIVRRVISCKKSGSAVELSPETYESVPEWQPNIYEQYQLTQGQIKVFDDDKIISITAVKSGGQNKSDIIELFPDTDGYIRFTPSKGDWKINVIYATRNRGPHRNYINMTVAASCSKLIQAVYEPHYNRYKEEFGKTIVGFFSDEPELGNAHLYEYGKRLCELDDQAWSEVLQAKLQDKWGESFKKYLPLLWEENFASDLKAAVRYDYMDAITRLMQSAFSEQIGNWCSSHGVEYVGHLIEDNNQHTRTGSGLGHFFRGESGQTMSGIDCIGGQVAPQGEWSGEYGLMKEYRNGLFYQYVLGKLGSSVAAIDDRKRGRAMCEIFGNYGWEEGVRLEKYLIDHFLVRGINHFVPHAFSPKPFPDEDCPPHFYAYGNNPQYRHFGAIMRYTNRVCEVMGERHKSPVAVLYYAECEWLGEYTLPENVVATLAENQIDYDFIPADVFAETEKYHTKFGKKLSVNGNTYGAFIIPKAQYLPVAVFKAAEELIKHGCTVVLLDGKPQGVYDGKKIEAEQFDDFTVSATANLVDFLKQKELTETEITPHNSFIRILHSVDSGSRYMIVNEGTQAYSGFITVKDKGGCYAYDAWENRLCKVQAKSTDKGTQINVNVFPLKPLIIVFDKPENVLTDFDYTDFEKIEWNDEWKRSICRSIDYPDFREEEIINLPDNAAEKFPKFSGFLRYEKEYVHYGSQTVLEITDAYEGVEVFVNGKSLGIQVAPPFSYDLTESLKTGRNIIAIEVATTLERELADLPDPLSDYLGIKKQPQCPSGINGKVNLYIAKKLRGN